MKKKYYFLLFALVLGKVLFSPARIQAVTWNDCPLGKTNDYYPGDCPRFIDTDNDNICDHSQLPPEQRKAEKVLGIAQKETIENNPNYYFAPLFLFLTSFYLFTFFLSRKKIITLITHRRFWNLLLTFSFFFNFLTSLLLILRLSYQLPLTFFPNLSFWHVETGIIFFLTSLFHLGWHLPYYRQVFKIKKQDR